MLYRLHDDHVLSLLDAIVVALGLTVADPIIGLVISLVILRITWQSFRTVQADPGLGELEDDDHDHAHAERAAVPG